LAGRRRVNRFRRGIAYNMVMVAFTIIAAAIVYMVMDFVVTNVSDQISALSPQTATTSTANFLITVWHFFPFVILLGILVYAVVQGQKRNPYEY